MKLTPEQIEAVVDWMNHHKQSGLSIVELSAKFKHDNKICVICGTSDSDHLWFWISNEPVCSKCHNQPLPNNIVLIEKLMNILTYWKSPSRIFINPKLELFNVTDFGDVREGSSAGFRYGNYTFLYKEEVHGIVIQGHPFFQMDFNNIDDVFDLHETMLKFKKRSHGTFYEK